MFTQKRFSVPDDDSESRFIPNYTCSNGHSYHNGSDLERFKGKMYRWLMEHSNKNGKDGQGPEPNAEPPEPYSPRDFQEQVDAHESDGECDSRAYK